MKRTLLLLVAFVAVATVTLVGPQVAAAFSCLGAPNEPAPACGGDPQPPPEEPAPPPEEPAPPPPGDDDGCGGCTDPDADGYETDIGGEERETLTHRGTCKGVYWARERRTWWGKVIFRYLQHVHWCWRDGVITYIHRTRWPEVYSWLWGFGGHVGSNCTETCGELAGSHFVDIQTVGHFQACKGWCFLHSYPRVVIRVTGWGTWDAESWGGGG